jgi:hypothetical protein
MRASHELRRFWPALFAFVMVALMLGPARAELNPAALQYKLPNQIEWKDTPIGAKMAVMHGDPDKACPSPKSENVPLVVRLRAFEAENLPGRGATGSAFQCVACNRSGLNTELLKSCQIKILARHR